MEGGRQAGQARLNFALLPIFLALGALVGFLAGLLGSAAASPSCPFWSRSFSYEGFAREHIVPMAIGTSAGTIIFTAFSSTRAHHARGAVNWGVVASMSPGIVAGSLLGRKLRAPCRRRSWRACSVRSSGSAPIGCCAMGLPCLAPTARQGWDAGGRRAARHHRGHGRYCGAFLAVPFMTRCNVKLHTAVATSAALAIPVAIAATVGFVLAGLHKAGLPQYAIGYVYLPGSARLSSRVRSLHPSAPALAHEWPVARLRHAFATMLFCLGAYMWWKAFHSPRTHAKQSPPQPRGGQMALKRGLFLGFVRRHLDGAGGEARIQHAVQRRRSISGSMKRSRPCR